MAIRQDSGGTGGGGGGGTGLPSSYQQSQQSDFNKSRDNLAAQGGGTAGAPAAATGPYDARDPRSATAPYGSEKDPLVYAGPDSRIAYLPASQVINQFYGWDAKTKDKFLSQLSLAGYNTATMKDQDIQKAWAQYVVQAAAYNFYGHKAMSPWEALGKDIAQNDAASKKPRTVTQTAKSYNLSTAEDAHALFKASAQQLLGRDPTKAEIARFKTTLNKFESANPSTTTTTSTYGGTGELTNQTSVTTGGVSQGAQSLIAEEEAKKNPEYGAYQAATTGMNWLMELVGGG